MSFEFFDFLAGYLVVLAVAATVIFTLGCLYWPKDKENRSDE